MSTESPLYKHIELPLCTSSALEHKRKVFVYYCPSPISRCNITSSATFNTQLLSSPLGKQFPLFTVLSSPKSWARQTETPFQHLALPYTVYLRAMTKIGQPKLVSFHKTKFIFTRSRSRYRNLSELLPPILTYCLVY